MSHTTIIISEANFLSAARYPRDAIYAEILPRPQEVFTNKSIKFSAHWAAPLNLNQSVQSGIFIIPNEK